MRFCYKKQLFLWNTTEAVAQRYSIKKVFLKILQNSQENICVGVSFMVKLKAWGLQLY